MSQNVHARTRQPRGVPAGGQFAAEMKAAPAGVTLEDVSGEPGTNIDPADMSTRDVMQSLWSDRDPLGLGTDYQTEARGVKVYYATDDAKAIGVNTTPTGMVQLFEYDPDDGDFDYPYLLSRTSPEKARAQAVSHLGIDEHANGVMARMKTLTDDEKRLMRAVYTDSNEGARELVRTAAFAAVSQASWEGDIPSATNVMHGQQQRAMKEAGMAGPEAGIAADAVWALQRRHLVGDPRVSDGNRGWTQRAYDQLTRPVREVLGPIHPDDAPMERLEPGFEDDVIAQAYAAGSPRLRKKAAEAAHAHMADRLREIGADNYTLYVRGDELRVDNVRFPRDPNPDESYALYGEAREIVEEFVADHLPLDAYQQELIAAGRRAELSSGDFAATTYYVDDYAGQGLAKAIELRDDIHAERLAKEQVA